ncbi:MAG: hypothetical protein DDT26_01292 [Dehalococcoidia bacterium]|nr:hypothetical protein [Chloroflexota bacterium]
MIAAVHNGRPDVNHRIAGDNPFGEGLLDPSLHRRDIFAGYNPALDAIHKFESRAGLHWLDLEPHVPVLTPPAGLANEATLSPGRDSYGFLVSHTGSAYLCFHPELAQ